MKFFVALALICAILMINKSITVHADSPSSRVVCFYDSSSFLREGLAKMSVNDLEAALPSCTHLIYGYAGINEQNNKMIPLHPNLDLDKGHYSAITALKRKNSNLKVLLSVGGGLDTDESGKYLSLLENTAGRIAFVNSAYTIVKDNNFDGLDLSWQFPPNRPKKIRGTFGSAFSKLKKAFGASSTPVDEKSDEHREEFTTLVRDLRNTFRHDNLLLTLTVLPNVNSTLFFDIPAIINSLDFVTLSTFDFQTPDRVPKEADFPAPLYAPSERNPEHNANYQIQHWLQNKCPPSKLNLGIAAFGRAWKTTSDSGIAGVPPITETLNEAPPGPQLGIQGKYSWPELCTMLRNPGNANLHGESAPLSKVGDPTRRLGNYAFRVPDDSGNFGLWVGYEDPDSVAIKKAYVLRTGLGGVAIFDLSLDDFRSTCSNTVFPILAAAKSSIV